ncbi:MAG TPA: tyrosine-type recombinase/integrase [Smithellaceae bacterium]|nr:tyrosine-type recombinase/integrase [Smithellaceae bacterium]
MSLYKRNSVWWMSFSLNGKQLRRSTETEDRKLAQRIFDKLKGEIAEGKWFERLPGEGYQFRDLMKKYMAEYSAVNKAASSHKRDKSIVTQLERVFGDYYLTEITPAMISDFKVKRRADGVSPRTINYELTTMSHAFNMAIREWGLVSDNPVKKVRKERVSNYIERWLTVEEEKKLLQASPKWLQDIIVFAINTGLRQSEILDLKWSQVDMQRRTVTIFEQKNRCVDTLPLNATVTRLLQVKRCASMQSDVYIFPNTLNQRKENRVLITAFHKALKRAGITKFRFHDLRHTFATRLVQNGVDLYKVQKLGRWKNVTMVQRYAHHYPESLRSAIEMIDGFRKPIITILSHSQKNRVRQSSLRLANP